MLLDVVGGGRECSKRPVFIFLLKKIGFAPWPGIMMSQTLVYYWKEIFLIDSGVRQWSSSLMISFHCLWVKSNNWACGQFECDVNWFSFNFYFVRSHAWCSCHSIVCWRELGGSYKIGRQRSRGGKTVDIDGQGDGSLEN